MLTQYSERSVKQLLLYFISGETELEKGFYGLGMT